MTTATATRRKPRPRPIRTVDVLLRHDARAPGAVTITMGKAENTYLVTPVPSDFGRAFRLEKLADDGSTVYDVLLDGRCSTCDCPGHTYVGRCKHVDTLMEMTAAGTL